MKNSMKIKFPIGDWSDDGHGKCRWFLVEVGKNNKESDSETLKRVREAHFKCKEVLGFDIGDICSKYNEYRIRREILDKISEEIWSKYHAMDEKSIAEQKEIYELEFNADNLIYLWLDILHYLDNELRFEVLDDNSDIPTINFYGVDEQRRHLNTPGYGLFD